MATRFSIGGNPQRTLDLLWGTGDQTRRGPKPALSIERIARAAIEIADAEGLETLSMQRIAERLGFSTMSLYRYVPGKAELIEVMLDAANGEPPTLDAVEDQWRARLERWARELLVVYWRHPWMVRIAISGPPLGPRQVAWFETALDAISRTGLSKPEMISTVILVSGYVRGEARFLFEMRQSEHHTGVVSAEWGIAYAPLLRQVLDTERFPTLSALLDEGVFEAPDDAPGEDTEFGLQRILDGIEAFVERRWIQNHER